jgi:hypothetical protein
MRIFRFPKAQRDHIY